MKKIWCTVVLILVAAMPVYGGGIELGIKSGLIENYKQADLQMAAYHLDQLSLIGGQVYISQLPMVDVIISGDYSWRERTYIIVEQNLKFKLRDLAVTATVVYPLNLGMATIYAGGGIGSHSLSYEYVKPLSLSLADNGVTIPEASTYFGYHGLIGAKIEVPAFPVGFFMEARKNQINAPGDDITFNSWAGGIFITL